VLKRIPEQINVAEKISNEFNSFKNIILDAPTGCHAKGTEILMYDGTIKSVENIQINDKIMGPDNLPRQIFKLHRGEQTMYDVIPNKGESFIVNEDHILSLQKTGDNNKKVNISINEYLKTSKTFKNCYKLYRTPIDFPEKKLKIPPYILGIWIGDGRNQGPDISNTDTPILNAWKKYANKIGLKVTINKLSHHISKGRNGKIKNCLLDNLKYYNLINNKHIPLNYKINSKQNRLELLAGLLDTDGYLYNNCFEIITKYDTLAKDILFLTKSLGFCSTSSIKKIKLKNWNESRSYHRITISGNLDIIPNKVERKKATPRKQVKSVLRTGFRIKKLKKDEYFGFTIDRDHLYLTSDFIVHHNCGKSGIAYFTYEKLNKPKTIILMHQKILQDQYHKLFYGNDDLVVVKGKENYNCEMYSNTKVSEAPCQIFQESKNKIKCPKKNECEYFNHRIQMLSKSLVVTNYQLILSLIDVNALDFTWDLCIYDECHNIEEIFTNYRKVTITEEDTSWYKKAYDLYDDICLKYRQKNLLNIGLDLIYNFSRNNWKQNFIDFYENRKKIIDLLDTHFYLIASNSNIKNISNQDLLLFKFFSREKKLLGKYSMLLENRNKAKFIFEYNENNDYINYQLTPLTINTMFNSIADQISHKKLFMSSTVFNPLEYLSQLGIKDNHNFVSLPSKFPIKNRKVLMKPISYLNKNKINNMSNDLQKVIDSIIKICNFHGNQNESGVIFTSSYTLSFTLERLLKDKLPDFKILINKNAKERSYIINEFRSNPDKKRLLISPSFFEGVNFENDISRFQIITKAPFLSLSSQYVREKVKIDRKWYEMNALISIVQACGRSIRHKEDRAITYCLDGNICRLYRKYWKLLHKWFVESVKLI